MVKLTKEQDAFIKTFSDKSLAFHYISSWGWDSWLRNGTGEVYELGAKTPFTLDEKEKMLNAIINGYEVIEPKFKFYNFSDRSDSTPLYYAGKENGLNRNKKFALEIEKDSEEYKALLTLGFIRE